jgi:putative oxidoreductase
MAALGLVVLRVTLAGVLIAHGSHQLFGVFSRGGLGPGGLSSTAEHFTAMNLEPAVPLAVLAGFIQLVGGVLIAAGWLTRLAALAVIAYLALIVWKDQAQWGFFLNWSVDPARGHGMELSVLIIGALVCLILTGGGELSFDGRRARVRASRASGRARLHGRT